ncbi:hypothetical protein HMPREF0380_01456 [Eubacterium infirmum F0142]|jgi:hypothetical protein|nr:hypothetical protein HMPREF0380_01456 [Eubacterium infirmum F0142]
MLRSEIQNKTGLTRKAIEYYEDKGLINPHRLENGYKDYTEKDLDILVKVSILRKLGVSLSEIKQCVLYNSSTLSSVLRMKEHQLEVDERRKNILELIVKGEKQELIDEYIAMIETEESIYNRLERVFPGYFGQLFFAAYLPFMNEPLTKDGEEAFIKYVSYLDNLPTFELSEDEKKFIDEISSNFDMSILKKVNEDKISTVENIEDWLEKNKDSILQYESYKNSEQYQNSLLRDIQEKLRKYMIDNNYYQVAIPLIRKFSKSYNMYYEKMIKANERFMNIKNV